MESEGGPRVAETFAKHGFVVLRECLDTEALGSFVRSVSDDLAAGRHSEMPMRLGRIGLQDPGSWPQPGALAAHRIVEVTPAPPTPTERAAGGGPHWRAMQQQGSPLSRALDELLGEGAWEVPCNGDPPSESRYWYIPVTLPEVPPRSHCIPLLVPMHGDDDTRVPAAALCVCEDSDAASIGPSPPFHLATLGPIDRLPPDAARLAAVLRCPEPCSDTDAARLWQPVNRRRVVGKGWHVDAFHAHAVVLLVLLSDWTPGCGGTALIPGTHAWVYRRWQHMQATLRHESPAGSAVGGDSCDCSGSGAGGPAAPVRMPDDAAAQRDLNGWVTRSMRALTEQGRVRLLHDGPGAAAVLEPSPDAPAPAVRDWIASDDVSTAAGSFLNAVQVTGRAGDVVLMHPLLVHSGTLNLGLGARILANGLARLRSPPPPGGLGPMDRAALPLAPK